MQPLDPEILAQATPSELASYERMLVRDIALLSPLDYALYVSDGRTKEYPHTELLSRHAKALVEHALYDSGIGPPAVWTPFVDDPEDGQWLHPETGEEAHSICVVSAPPQFGKSWIITETVPAWYLTKYPHNRVIVTGYEAEFAKGFGRANRDKIESVPELGITVNKNTRAADNWQVDGHDGGLITAGTGGGITGKRADLILIDDPVKNQDEALSEASRKKNKNWWESVVKSRIRTNTVTFVIQTRWHEDDLAGHIIQNERCFSLNMPALAFDTVNADGISIDPDTGVVDPLNRKPGESLCPALQTRSMLLNKMEKGDGGDEPGGMLWFSALYQGKPNIEGGGIIPGPYNYFSTEQNFSGRTFYKTAGGKESYANECIYFITADLAVSTRTTADYTVFSLFAWTPNAELLLVDMFRKRIESTDHEREAERFWRRAKELSCGAGVRFFGVENKTFGLSLIQSLRRGLRVPVRPLEADTDKVARAIPVGMYVKEGRLFINNNLEGLSDLEREMQSFPNGKHDDMVDTLGYAVREAEHLPKTSPQGRDRKKKRKRHPVVGRWT